jgi:hypothetical protein
MVVPYVNGQPVEALREETERLFARMAELNLAGEVEFRGPDGRSVGRATPPAKEPLCPWEPDLTKDEIQRRINEPGGMTLDEFWRKMGVK